MPVIPTRLDVVVRIHGGTALRGVAIDEKKGKVESHITIGTTTAPYAWPFTLLGTLASGSPLNVTAAAAVPTKAECAAALDTRLKALNPVLGVSDVQMVGGQAHYWSGTRWVLGTSPLAFQHGFVVLQAGLSGPVPFEQQLLTGQGGTTSLVLDLVIVLSAM